MAGVDMLMRSMGIDPDAVKQFGEKAAETVNQMNNKLDAIMRDNALILSNQVRIMQHLKLEDTGNGDQTPRADETGRAEVQQLGTTRNGFGEHHSGTIPQ